MMRGGFLRLLAILVSTLFLQAAAHATETITYTYDALGRLVAVSSSGSVNNGQAVSTTFDPAGNRTNYTVTGAGSATPTVAIGNASVTEGGTLVFTVTRSGNISGTASVSYATASGTATSGSDFTAASGTLNFAANQATATINVVTIDDTAVESTETMTVTLSNPSAGLTITTAVGTGTINDNDSASANLAIGNASVTEGGTLAFTVTRSGNTTSAVSVNYASASGSATSGSDFTAVSGTLNFAANQTSATINVVTIDDTAVESTETMTVTLSNPSSGATITTATGTGTINDNDAPIAITDSYFQVLPAHQSVYFCNTINIPEMGIDYQYCGLNSNSNDLVFVSSYWQSPLFDPGYSMPTIPVLLVEPAYYGTGNGQ